MNNNSVNTNSENETGGAARLTRRERQRLRHRTEILEAAEAVFAEKGYHASTMEEIASRAEFSVGAIYYFFKNKEDLYAEIWRHRGNLFERRLRRLIARDKSPVQIVADYFRAKVDLFWEFPRFFSLLFRETRTSLGRPGGGYVPEVVESYGRFLGDLEKILQKGMDTGEFKPLGAGVLVVALEGLIHSYAEYLYKNNVQNRDPQEETRLVEFYLHGAVETKP